MGCRGHSYSNYRFPVNVENEATDLLKTIAQKIMPWINEVVYS